MDQARYPTPFFGDFKEAKKSDFLYFSNNLPLARYHQSLIYCFPEKDHL
jgi:hypothetical protein